VLTPTNEVERDYVVGFRYVVRPNCAKTEFKQSYDYELSHSSRGIWDPHREGIQLRSAIHVEWIEES